MKYNSKNSILLDVKKELKIQKNLLENVLEKDENRDELLILLTKEISLLRMEIEYLAKNK